MKQAIILGALLLSFLPSCSTMEGAGKDIEGAGEALEHAAKSTHESIRKN